MKVIPSDVPQVPFRFVRIRRTDYNFGDNESKHWYLLVETFNEMVQYIQIRARHAASLYWSGRKKAEDEKIPPHWSREEAAIMYAVMGSKEKRLSCFHDVIIASDAMCNGMTKVFRESGALLVNISGGYFPLIGHAEIIETLEKEKYEFPQDSDYVREVNILQWVNGQHWYAKVGMEDVCLGRQTKVGHLQ